MVCQDLTIMGARIGIEDYLVYPTTCYYHFWSVVLFVLFVIISYGLYNRERETQVQPDLISSLGVGSTVILFLTIIGTLITSTDGTPMIQQDVLLIVVAFWIVISGIWFFKK